jgi:hypothetical protein
VAALMLASLLFVRSFGVLCFGGFSRFIYK